jgi:prepilin-type N-terminal cleavage/methylation domain-containing protein
MEGMRNKKNNGRAGFSLLELLLYIAILAIITTFVAGAFFSIDQGRARVEASTEVNANLRFAVEKMTQDIRNASAVALPAVAGATSTSVQLTVGGTVLTYCMPDGHIRRQSGGSCTVASDAITGNTVIADSLVFTRIENANATLGKTFVTIGVSLGLHYNSDAPEWQYSATKQTTVPIRQ